MKFFPIGYLKYEYVKRKKNHSRDLHKKFELLKFRPSPVGTLHVSKLVKICVEIITHNTKVVEILIFIAIICLSMGCGQVLKQQFTYPIYFVDSMDA